jgi:hypothetical protein
MLSAIVWNRVRDRLESASYSTEAAKAYSAFVLEESHRQALQEIGVEVLRAFKPVPGACVMMSAMYAARLKAVTGAPVHTVAGSLAVGREPVFGHGKSFDGRTVFSQSHPSWDGHAWVMLGDMIADVSLFRTAYSRKSPPLLAAHVRREFGEGRGLLIVRWGDAPKSGLRYSPQYVLTEVQVGALALSAVAVLAGGSPPLATGSAAGA